MAAAHHCQGISMQQMLRGVSVSLSQRLQQSIKTQTQTQMYLTAEKREQKEVGASRRYRALLV